MSGVKDVYSVFENDTGQISMSNKVFDNPDDRYGDILREREMRFLNHGGDTHASLDQQFVWNGELSERPMMPAVLDKNTIAAGGIDGAVIRGVPNGAALTIFAGDIQFYPAPGETSAVSGKRVDLSAPVPGVYTVVLSLWPYREWRAEIVAT